MVSCSITHLHYDDAAPRESEQGKTRPVASLVFLVFFSDWCSRRTAANENTIIVSLSWLHGFWFFKKVLKQLVFVVFGFQFIDFFVGNVASYFLRSGNNCHIGKLESDSGEKLVRLLETLWKEDGSFKKRLIDGDWINHPDRRSDS